MTIVFVLKCLIIPPHVLLTKLQSTFCYKPHWRLLSIYMFCMRFTVYSYESIRKQSHLPPTHLPQTHFSSFKMYCSLVLLKRKLQTFFFSLQFQQVRQIKVFLCLGVTSLSVKLREPYIPPVPICLFPKTLPKLKE